jgi:hypothetical protein
MPDSSRTGGRETGRLTLTGLQQLSAIISAHYLSIRVAFIDNLDNMLLKL